MDKHRVADSLEPDGGPVVAALTIVVVVFALGVLVGWLL